MSSGLFKSALVGVALISTTLVAPAQDAPGRAEIAGVGSESRCPHIAVVCALLADPAIRNFVGLADNDWDFNATANAYTAACANRDIQIITLIEDHGDAADVAPERLFEASLAMMRARVTCAEGREHEALSLYDEIALGLKPTHAAR